MNNLIRITVAVSTLVAVALWNGWYEPFHLVIGGAAWTVGMIAVLLWRQHRQEVGGGEDADAEEATESPFRAAFFGVLAGAFICSLLGLVLAGAGRIQPIVRFFENQQRKEFEARLQQIVEAGNHTRAVELVQKRLRGGKLSGRWRADLVSRLYDHLIEVARASTSFDHRTNLLHQAVAVARTNSLNGQVAAAMLDRELERAATRSKLDRLKAQRRWADLIPALQFSKQGKADRDWEVPYNHWLYDAYLEWAKDSDALLLQKERLLLALKAARDFGLQDASAQTMLEAVEKQMAVGAVVQRAEERIRAEARTEIDRLQTRIAEANEQQKRGEAEAQRRLQRAELEARYQGFLDAGDSFQDPDPQRALERRRELYGQARDFAQRHGLDLQPVTTRLNKVSQNLAELLARLQQEAQPADLPSGVSASIVRIATDRFPPSIDLEMLIEDAAGQPIRGLKPKDFQIACADQVLTNFALATVQNRPPPLFVVVAIDCSGSMKGEAIGAAIQGAQRMIRGLAAEDRVFVRVLAFCDKVESLCSWTADLRQAEAAVAGLSAGGTTALYAAVETAVKELKSCKGDRRLLLFTDGKDTVASSRFSLSALTAELRTNEVQVFTIGLLTGELDGKTLQHLATGTGGSHFIAAAPSQIATQFLAARQLLRRAIYRFVLTPGMDLQTDGFTLRIKVGRANAVEKRIAVSKGGLISAME